MWGFFVQSKINPAFYNLLFEFWLSSFVRKENDQESLNNQQFIENESERIIVSNYLKRLTDLSTLRRMIYEGGLIDNKRHFSDETNVYDKYVFFTLSYLCTVFWLLEDNPNSIKGKKFEIINEIKMIAEGIENSNKVTIINELMGILRKIRVLDEIKKPTKCESIKLNGYPILEYKEGEKFVEDEIIKYELDNKINNKQFDIFKFFNNPNPDNFLTPLILNIYAFLKKEDRFSIIGIERSGIPIASLVAYEFDLPLYILRTVPELKLLPNEVIKNKAVIIDDISITGTNLKRAENHLNKKVGIKSLKTLVIVKDKYSKNVDKFFIAKNDKNYELKNKFENFNLIDVHPSLNQDLYLFSWENVPGNDNERLIEFLTQKYSIDWAKTAKIEKIGDDKTIRLTTEKKSLSLILNNEKTKAKLKIDDLRTDEFIVKLENGKLNIYQDLLKTTIKNYCTKNDYWFSEYAYCKGLFRPICDRFIELIKEKGIQDRCLIISTSTFGLPFASVVSYKLQRPLYLFSRRPNLMLDFNLEKSLKEYFKKGFTSIAFIDDVFSSGVTEIVAEERLNEIAAERLFSWNETPGNDNGRLIEFLTQKFDIDWVKTAKIEKIDEVNTIRVSNEKNYLSLILNDEKGKVDLKIDDGRTDEFIAKMENDKLNIYKDINLEINRFVLVFLADDSEKKADIAYIVDKSELI